MLHQSLRAAAVLEAFKGTVALLAAAGLPYFHHLANRLHLNAGKHYPNLFNRLLEDASNGELWAVAALVIVYAAVRFIEAYGLWRSRAWAEWLAAVSGAIYVPFELYELSRGVSWIKLTALVLNVAVVALMVYALRARKLRQLPT